jgi:CRISPR-associated protein Csd1
VILQALKEYYDRKAALADTTIAPPSWERKELPFLIVLDATGTPVAIEDTREGEGRNRRSKSYLVPQTVKRTVGIAPNLLWDNPEYALGVVIKGNSDRVTKQHQAFIDRIRSLGLSHDPAIAAILAFLSYPDKATLLDKFTAQWDEIHETAPFLSFKIAGDIEPIFRQPAVVSVLSRNTCTDQHASACLITGLSAEIERLHPAIKGVRDANSTGANIVGFNLDAFRSFGKEQGANAPVSKAATFAYATALNTLLARDSTQKLQIGDATTVFWSDRASSFEARVCDFFSEPPKDDPDHLVEAVKSLYRSAETGAYATDEDKTCFHVLGLSPNAARLAIRFWHSGTISEMADRFRQHFDDLQMAHGPKDRDYLSIWRYLVATAVQGKSENIPPSLAGNTMRAILEGLPYPKTLVQATLLRIRSEREVTYPRAALIKACLNRSIRFNNPTHERELTVSLDITNAAIGYRLGRLFAVLEKIQERANPGINATIRDRFYGAASSTPVTVFGNLMRLKNHHLAKLDHVGERINYEKIIGEIMSGIGDFPAHLALDQQGRFAIGYYHQRQDFFTKKSDKE